MAPALGSVLRAVEIPASGGSTLWADMGAAYDNLPDATKQRIEGSTANTTGCPPGCDDGTQERIAALRQTLPGRIEHPVVVRHPATGRRLLYVNEPFTTRIVGLGEEESRELLHGLVLQARIPEYQVRFRWQPDSVAIWHNIAEALRDQRLLPATPRHGTHRDRPGPALLSTARTRTRVRAGLRLFPFRPSPFRSSPGALVTDTDVVPAVPAHRTRAVSAGCGGSGRHAGGVRGDRQVRQALVDEVARRHRDVPLVALGPHGTRIVVLAPAAVGGRRRPGRMVSPSVPTAIRIRTVMSAACRRGPCP